MQVVYNINGTIDFAATREYFLGNSTEYSEEDNLYGNPSDTEDDSEELFI
jgi:hypothetical protein